MGCHCMKLKADRAALLKALAHVQSVVEKRNTIPILANVLIAVREGALTLTATDADRFSTMIRRGTPGQASRNRPTTGSSNQGAELK